MAKIDPLKCGDCGGETFKIRHIRPKGSGRVGGGGFSGKLRVVCVKCKSTSTIGVEPQRLEVDGHLCGGWGS
jgi:hypothetical protein